MTPTAYAKLEERGKHAVLYLATDGTQAINVKPLRGVEVLQIAKSIPSGEHNRRERIVEKLRASGLLGGTQ